VSLAEEEELQLPKDIIKLFATSQMLCKHSQRSIFPFSILHNAAGALACELHYLPSIILCLHARNSKKRRENIPGRPRQLCFSSSKNKWKTKPHSIFRAIPASSSSA
jgi:hypothetical protein